MILISWAFANPPVDVVRQRLAGLPPAQARVEARQWLTEHLRDTAIESWMGTRWAFYGTSQRPGNGTIACGYFVSTLLEQAGLSVERVFMAQQASVYIVKTFAKESELKRFRGGSRQRVVDWVGTQPDGIYAVGLDFHTGLLVKRAEKIEFCHSSYVSDRAHVQCNSPTTDPGFVSNYHIVGPVLTDPIVDAWLKGTRIRTFRP